MDRTSDASPELVLAPNIQLHSAMGMPGAEEGDVILDCPDQRTHSKLVNAEVGELLNQFRTPTRLPDAIAALTKGHDLDPYALLEQAVPIVEELRSCGFIQAANSVSVQDHRLALGDTVGGYVIRKILRQTKDTEVALALNSDGVPVAVKTIGAAAPEQARSDFLQEIDFARALAGTIAPKILEVTTDNEAPLLVSEWIEGVPIDRYIETCCGSPSETLVAVIRVLEAYAGLHARGILHGDVRPSNILLDGRGRVRLIDFGLSRRAGPTARKLSFELRYLEPEAAARLREEELPHLTSAGETCSLTLVLAEAISGRPARALPALREDALTQIASHTPDIRTGIAAIDRVLQRAVSPLDEGRASIAELKAGLEKIRETRPGFLTVPEPPISEPSVDAAVLMLRRAELHDDPHCLAAAGLCLRRADESRRFGDDTSSPLYSLIGRAVLRARIAYAMRRFDTARDELVKLTGFASNPRDSAELFSGSAGDLAHLSRLYADYGPADARLADLITPMATLLDLQLSRLETALDRLEKGAPTHLGMAHGLCGQIYSALKASEVLGHAPGPSIRRGLDALAARAVPVARGVAWPGTVHPVSGQPVTADHAPGWCNGSAGFLILWIIAARLIPDPRFQSLAKAAAHYTLGHPDRTPNLCCGLAGRAIALSKYADWMGAETWRRAAQRMAATCGPTPASGSIFRGQAGVELARSEVSGNRPRFPI